MTRKSIVAKYGPGGIKEFDEAYGRVGAITDDTQMTLFTIEGLLRGWTRYTARGLCSMSGMVEMAYRRWLVTQGHADPQMQQGSKHNGWLITVQGLHSRRAPGNTCLSSLLDPRRLGKAENDSKGCGAVMRSAPFGVVCEEPFSDALECAAITHGNLEGQIPAGYFALIINRIVKGSKSIQDAVQDRDNHLMCADGLYWAIDKATKAVNDNADIDIEQFGQGWVADEALAIAIYAAMKAKDFEDGIRIAVNHSGDSDSTGAIAGNILGAHFGIQGIPQRFVEAVELRDEILQLANDMYDVFFGGTFRGWLIDDEYMNYDGTRSNEFQDFWTKYPGA